MKKEAFQADWSLSAHVRACDCGSTVILLDLRRSRYVGITKAAAALLADRVSGWPVRHGSPNDLASDKETDRIAQSLFAQRLLTNEQIERPPAIDLVDATESIDAHAHWAKRSLTPARLLSFTASVALAAWRLRFLSLEANALAITNRRSQRFTQEPESLEAMKPRVAAYEALRPFVFTARERCLLDSLALIGFLARDGFTPHWVIGVKTNPFGAHSWVQSGAIVLNDQHEYVRQFRPILVV